MNRLSLIENILKLPSIHKQNEKVRLPAGGLFQGKVLKLFPGQNALIGLGGIKLHARLEVPLILNQKYLFQVLSNPGLPVLKVVQPLDGNSRSGASSDGILLGNLGLRPDSKNQALLNHLIDENIPFTKTVLKHAGALLENMKGSRDGIGVLAEMIKRDMPITLSVFDSVRALLEEKPISQDLAEIRAKLGSRLPASHPLFRMLETDPAGSGTLLELIKTAAGQSPSKKEAFNLLMKTGLTEENVLEIIHTYSRYRYHDGSSGVSVLDDLFTRSEAAVSRSEASAALQQLLKNASTAVNDPEIDFLENLFLKTVTESGRFRSAVNEMEQLLGLHHEKNAAAGKGFPSVKAELMELIREGNLPADIRDRLQQTVNRLTGIQLASVQTNNAIEQFTVQVPFQFAGETRDITIQFQGKKKKGGGIDPDYCSMIVAVNMEHLGDIAAGILVQNRVVTINILADKHLEPLIQKWKPALAGGLAEIGYRLSSVKAASTAKQPGAEDAGRPAPYHTGRRQTGVDYKI